MNRLIKSALLTLAVGAASLSALGAAQADDWRWRNGGGWHGGGHGGGWHGGGWHGGGGWDRGGWRGGWGHDDGAAIAAGVAGLAIGALAAGIVTDPGPGYDGDSVYEGPVYDGPAYERRLYVERPRVVYRSARPWTRGWYDYCSSRYRTFDAQSGTFVGNDGREHFCAG